MLAQSGGVSVSTCASRSPWGRPPPAQKDNNVLWVMGSCDGGCEGEGEGEDEGGGEGVGEGEGGGENSFETSTSGEDETASPSGEDEVDS